MGGIEDVGFWGDLGRFDEMLREIDYYTKIMYLCRLI